jgi:hypothetical protein
MSCDAEWTKNRSIIFDLSKKILSQTFFKYSLLITLIKEKDDK